MKGRGVQVLLVTVLLVLVAGIWLGWDSLFEKVEVEEPEPADVEVLRNQYRALEELLNRIGLPSRTASGLEGLPPGDAVLWWLARSRRVSPDKLLAWVEGGGHLILEPQLGSDPESNPISDPVLDAAGIGVFFEAEADDDDHLSAQEFQVERPAWPKFYLMEEDMEVVATEGATDAAWNITVAYGEGMVTALNSSRFATNPKIAERDHALLVWHLVRADEDRTGVTLVTRDPKPSVWLILGRRAVPVAISLAALSFFGLWAFARRMGPIQPSPSRDRRHLAEHLRASGNFLWRVGCEDVLLAAQRQALSQRLLRGGAYLGNDPGRRRQKLLDEASRAADKAGLQTEPVIKALKVREMRDRDRFVGIVRLLEALRRHKEA